MSMRNKLAEAMAKGIDLERQRCLGILLHISQVMQDGLNCKLMTASEKHLAQVKATLASSIIAAAQIKIMSGEQPHGAEIHEAGKPNPLHRPDDHALGRPPGEEDGGRAS